MDQWWPDAINRIERHVLLPGIWYGEDPGYPGMTIINAKLSIIGMTAAVFPLLGLSRVLIAVVKSKRKNSN
jgi:hypothetical protein